MITFSNKYRSNQLEIMDDFELKGEEMKTLLTDLKRVNKWLGGTAITLDGVETLSKSYAYSKPLKIVDIGCGDGEMLRQCAQWSMRQGISIDLVGIDGNENIIQEARNRSNDIKNCTFRVMDIFAPEAQLPECDIVLCTLFLHHFKEAAIINLLTQISQKAKVGVVINDLDRNYLAFWLFKLFSFFFIKTSIARHDGLVSVARGFKRQELQHISNKINGTHHIGWKWAFRWQWIIHHT